MTSKLRFYINSTQNHNGPSIFGSRLRNAIIEQGWQWDMLLPKISYVFSAGFFRPFCKNILRLDGLYFDSQNTVGDSNMLNYPISKAYRKADGIIFQSEFDHKLFATFMGEPRCKHRVIQNGVPASFSPHGESVDFGFRKTILCSAKWKEHKRLRCIINGFIEYGNEDTGLVILGSNIKNRVDHPNVKYIGNVLPSDLPKYLRGGDAFLHLAWLDHCPNTVVEAIACGLPVLCGHNGGTKDIVKSNGVVMQFEEDYDFKKVNLYKPPKCNKQKVAEGIEKVLNWKRPLDVDHLKIETVAREYMLFSQQIH